MAWQLHEDRNAARFTAASFVSVVGCIVAHGIDGRSPRHSLPAGDEHEDAGTIPITRNEPPSNRRLSETSYSGLDKPAPLPLTWQLTAGILGYPIMMIMPLSNR
jgi:hypothetical protein